MSELFSLPFLPILNLRALPSAAAKAFFYITGTTTLKPIYADAGMTTQLPNPVIADNIGRLPPIYLSTSGGGYRVRIVDAAGVLLNEADPYGTGLSGVITPYTVATLPKPGASTFLVAFVTDAVAADGSTGVVGYWNGSAWKRLSDNGPIASSYTTGLTLLGVGDSIMAGAYATSNFLDLSASAFGSPAINRGYWGNSWNIDWPGTGDGTPAASHTGTLIQDVPADTAALAAVVGTAKKVIAFAGRNGLAPPNNHSAATEYADFQTWLSAIVAAGVPASSVYVCTALPATDLDEGKRTAYNTMLIDGAATLGYNLIRFDLDPIMGAAGAGANSTYYLDGIHPTNAGQTRLANIVLSVLGGTGQPRRHDCYRHWR
jgi:lysophospholipase L1-like esterase